MTIIAWIENILIMYKKNPNITHFSSYYIVDKELMINKIVLTQKMYKSLKKNWNNIQPNIQ